MVDVFGLVSFVNDTKPALGQTVDIALPRLAAIAFCINCSSVTFILYGIEKAPPRFARRVAKVLALC